MVETIKLSGVKKTSNNNLQRLSIEEFHKAEKYPVIIVLDNVRSLNNVGSVFRTADAFRCEAVYLCGITGTPPHREIQKTALGATDSVRWKYFKNTTDAIKELQELQYIVYAVEQVENSIMLNIMQIEPQQRYALVFGNEMNGISQEALDLCQQCIEIPQSGTKHSLNIAVSVGIVIWDFYCFFNKQNQY